MFVPLAASGPDCHHRRSQHCFYDSVVASGAGRLAPQAHAGRPSIPHDVNAEWAARKSLYSAVHLSLKRRYFAVEVSIRLLARIR